MPGKHRKNVIVRTEPRVQPAPKHRGTTVVEVGRHVLREPQVFTLRDLMQASFVGNPYRGRA